ncbi:MAG TPA: DNA polymerase IV [Candidatus Acidoferrales bacterium]|nr:DNA polymerase IV [Candidatus Acidoferrales bacterium]
MKATAGAGRRPFLQALVPHCAIMPRGEPWPRTILHVDLDAFYASVHQRDDPSLRGQPVAVAGASRRAVVAGASYEARAYGVQSAMPLYEAIANCPNLVVVRPDPPRYRTASRRVHQIFRRFTAPELIEPVALDEAYLDVTVRSRHGAQSAEDLARRIKQAVRSEVGLTASVGVATSKLLAKVAGASRKPDGLVLVLPGTEADFLGPLPIGVIPGLGPKTEERLRLAGVRSVGELAGLETQRAVQMLGSTGGVLQRLAQGRDRTPVSGLRKAKTISAETTFEYDVVGVEGLEAALHDLVARVGERLLAEGVRARTVYVKLKLADFQLVSRQVSRTAPTDDIQTIFLAARTALDKSHLGRRPVRLLGVGVSGLEHPRPDLQMTLFA